MASINHLAASSFCFTNETASGQTAPPSGLMNMFGDNSSSSYGGEEVEESVGEDSTYPDMVAEPEVGRASRYPDQSGFSSYGSTESAPRMPTKEEAPPGSLFGMFKDATMKKRDDPNKVIPY